MPDPQALAATLLEKYDRDPFNLLQMLVEIQEACHWVPPEARDALSRELFGDDRLRVQGVVRFYSFLSETYQGEYVILLSDNITDQMQGSRALGDYLCSRLGVKLGRVRGDGRVSVNYTSCTGMCDQGPAGLINGQAVTRLTRERMDQIVTLINARQPLAAWPRAFFQVDDHLRRTDVLLRNTLVPGTALRACLYRGSDGTLQELYRSDLRGRGGAGFKTAIKWDSARKVPAAERYVLCNADEGEPGTFKDRVLLQSFADLVIEGMTVGGFTLGAREGILYVRGEYRYLKDHLEGVLARRRAANLLGEGILGSGFSFDVKLHWGAGAYICGMETAMIESIEGKRGIPRKRFPLPVEAGYRGEPTVVNNVETFAAAAHIGLRGGAWFARHGTPHATGTKLFCVSGDCGRPGIYEYPWGIRCRELLRDCEAGDPQYLQISGPSGTTVPERDFDRRLAFDDLSTVGTVMVFDRSRDLFAMTGNFARFFRHECCGLCTPCRLGTTLLVDLVDKFAAGLGSPADLDEFRNLSKVMDTMSHCGLGQTAHLHLMDALEQFPEVFAGRMQTDVFEPAFDLDAALAEARSLSGRDDPDAHL